ncbi:YcjF family protein [Rosenbergiella australiborealis]|uniref:YcjF family protein n=1 Tax=Rosenbergiella australiborealis TaxID=1544696 RepID=UPI001F4ED8F8|nr:TIGR01620 family protein [Rosenbergiella australiborealis]
MKDDNIKPRIDFSVTPTEHQPDKVKAAYYFDAQQAEENFIPESKDDEPLDTEQTITLERSFCRPRLPMWGRLLLLGILILLVSGVAQLVQTMITAWQDHQWFSMGLAFSGVMIVSAALGAVLSECLRLRRLKKQMDIHQQAHSLLSSHEHRTGRAFCEALIKNAGLSAEHPAVINWYAALDPSLTDREVVILYSTLIQPTFDNQARRLIRHTATHSALMVAASPYAVVDMALVAWRSLRMINQIAKLYQVEPGYLGRVRLLRSVLINMAIAGASEWVQESSIDWLSQDLAARLSARVAQGVGVGLLTARLGIKTMTLCRPIPWSDGEAPTIGEFRRGLIADLTNKIRTK